MTPTNRDRWMTAIACALGAGLVAPARADVNLEWRPVHRVQCVGTTVEFGLYAVSDDPDHVQLMSAMDVIFQWDPARLELLGVDDTGACDWLFSGFLTDAYGLNEVLPPQDGDGMYTAFANLGEPVAATPAGTLVTTFRFTALSGTSLTTLEILESGGDPEGRTVVYDGTKPNNDITGTLGSATAELGYRLGDLDRNGLVGLSDLSILLSNFGQAGMTYDDGDLDGDGDVDLTDLSILLGNYGQGCP